MIENGVTPLLSAQELYGMGFKIVMNPLSALLAATKQIFSIYTSLYQKGTTANDMDDIAELDVSRDAVIDCFDSCFFFSFLFFSSRMSSDSRIFWNENCA